MVPASAEPNIYNELVSGNISTKERDQNAMGEKSTAI